MRLYQGFQDTNFIQQRDKIRAYIQTRSENLNFSGELLQTFTRGAVWDAITFSGVTLSGTNAFLQKSKVDLSTKMQNVLDVVEFQDLELKAKETLRNLVQ